MAKSKQDYFSDTKNSSIPSAYSNVKSEIGAEYPEIQNIREDISALKNDVVSLGQHVRSNGGKHAEEIRHFGEKQFDKAKKAGVEALHKVERRVTEKPAQTIALAFFAGLATSFLLGRKR